MSHKLILHTADSIVNNKYIYVKDLSIWDPMLEIKYKRFQVLVPFGESYVEVEVPTEGYLALTSVNLRISKGLEDLPDGSYSIHYSVSPNDKVFIERGHYRVASLMNAVKGKMALIDFPENAIDDCGNVELDKHQNTLLHIFMLLTGAFSIGTDINAMSKADGLYRQAMREYDKLFDRTCINC